MRNRTWHLRAKFYRHKFINLNLKFRKCRITIMFFFCSMHKSNRTLCCSLIRSNAIFYIMVGKCQVCIFLYLTHTETIIDYKSLASTSKSKTKLERMMKLEQGQYWPLILDCWPGQLFKVYFQIYLHHIYFACFSHFEIDNKNWCQLVAVYLQTWKTSQFRLKIDSLKPT